MSKRCPYRWFLVKPRIAEKLSDCLVFCCNILTGRYLAAWRLSANCLDGLLTRGIQTTGIVCAGRIIGDRDMGITTSTYWADVWL